MTKEFLENLLADTNYRIKIETKILEDAQKQLRELYRSKGQLEILLSPMLKDFAEMVK